jgi:hypothetical protein
VSQPGGSPASSSSSASRNADSGVALAGFRTVAQPAASADDPPRDAQRERELSLARLRAVHRDHLAGQGARLDGGERERRHRALRFDPRGLHRLARLVGDEARDFVVAAAERAGDLHEDLSALVRRQRLTHRLLGGIDRRSRLTVA